MGHLQTGIERIGTMKIQIGLAITTLIEEWQKAVRNDFVDKPIAYALYQTWKLYNANEPNRHREDGANET